MDQGCTSATRIDTAARRDVRYVFRPGPSGHWCEADGPDEGELKAASWRQVTDPAVRSEFPRLAMLNWFEWRKDEPEVGGTIDWRLTSDPGLARELIAQAPAGWLRFGGLDGG